MKPNFIKALLVLVTFTLTNSGFSQTIIAGKAGKFGIDGDLISDQSLSGLNAAQQAGTHDWFQKPGGAGIGLFDTTGAAALKSRLMAGANLAFSRKMQYTRYSVQDGDILMDASYTRDEIGIIGSNVFDKTMFYSDRGYAAQLGGDPSKWRTVPSGGQLPSKADIVDTYVNMRRNGSTVSGNNPSHIMLHVGATTLASDGDRYVSFVFLKERITYDSTTGFFSNSGPAATGGHSAWAFNADSTVKTAGDVSISFNFGSGGVQSIQLLIWCNYEDYIKLNPAKFDFVNGQWYGVNPKGGWGWAGIVRNSGSALQVWGATNNAQTSGPAWGTTSKSLGVVANNYAFNDYEQYQFAEASIDLTSAGLDFALTSENACSPPFTRYFVATRSSSGFTAPMMDFIGPYEFLDAPPASAAIASPGNFTCASGTMLSLSAKDYIRGTNYSWKTTGGNIAKGTPDSSTIQISKPGIYTLTATVMQGCASASESVVVGEDYYRPIAKARTTGITFPGASATLFGGDAVASNYATPHGGSKGLSYLWTGPAYAFPTSTPQSSSTTLQDPVTKVLGNYQLVVTEARNGCKDTASVTVVDSSTFRIVLGVKFTDFSVNADKAKKVNTLSWKTADVSDVERFVVEKSANSTFFSPAGNLVPDPERTNYYLNDPAPGITSYYRVKAVTKSGATVYTHIVKVKDSDALNSLSAYTDGSGSVVVTYTSPLQQTVSVVIVSMSGQVLKKIDKRVSAGSQVFRIGELGHTPSGVFLVQVQSANNLQSVKLKL